MIYAFVILGVAEATTVSKRNTFNGFFVVADVAVGWNGTTGVYLFTNQNK
jgi:hypothetical protein